MIREENINCTVEALILASPEPVSMRRLTEVIEEVSPARIRQAVDDLNNVYMGCGNSFRIREIGGGYQVHILPDFEQPIKKLLIKQRTVRLSRAALETLAIIAYKQPVTKIEIEHIRGVASDGVIHNLLQRQLIVISGRSESAGRPLLYKTSNEFLKFFGLNRLSDLPRMDEIEEMIRMAETPREQTVLELQNDREGAEIAADDAFSEDEYSEDDEPLGEMEAEEEDSGNGHRENIPMIASVDIDEFIDEDEELTDEDSADGDESADDNGNGRREARFESHENGAEYDIEPSDAVGELAEDEIAEPDNGGRRLSSTVIYYEPLPEKPPAVFMSDEMPAMASGDGNGNSVESSETDEEPSEN